jgi:hypothetical protein
MTEDCKKFPVMTQKSKLAEALCLSESALQDLLNRRYYDDLELIGYKKDSRLISRAVLIYLHHKVALLPEDFEKEKETSN